MNTRQWTVNQNWRLFQPLSFKQLVVVSLILGTFFVAACAGPPEALLTASIMGGQAPLKITFTNTSKNADQFQWDFGDGATETSADAKQAISHEYTKAGTHTVTLKAIKKAEPPQVSTATLAIRVDPGPLSKVLLLQTPITLMAGESQTLSAQALDQFDNPISGLSFRFKAEEAAGQVDAGGNLTAAKKAATYTNALTVEATQGSITKTATANVIVKPGPLHQVKLEPSIATVEVAKGQAFTATAMDQYDNPIPGLSFTFKGAEKAGQVDKDGKLTAANKAGTYENAVTVEVTQGAVTKTATANVAIKPGPLDRVQIEPTTASLEVAKGQTFTATALDQYGNPIPGLTFAFRSNSSAGQIDKDGRFTARTSAGAYKDAITVEVTEGSITKSAMASVTLRHGPLERVQISPGSAKLRIGQSQAFTARAVDAYGNAIPDAQIAWEAEKDVGSLTAEGRLTTGTKAGIFSKGLMVTARQGAVSRESTLSVTVDPDPLDSVSIRTVNVAAGATYQLQALSTDKYGNPVTGVQRSYTLRGGNAGSLSSGATGVVLTGGQVAGKYSGVLDVEATQGTVTRSATTDVVVTPGPLAQVVVGPSAIDLGMGMTQQFVAVGADKYGNRISGITFNWSVEAGGGTLDAKGLFTAGATPGTYGRTVKAVAAQGDVTLSAAASVTVEPDRIAFHSHRDGGDSGDVYVMNADGSNTKRVTYATAVTTLNLDADEPSWSPDGKRIAYKLSACQSATSCGYGVVVIAADGSGTTLLTPSGSNDAVPDWSPDGTRIVLASAIGDYWQIFAVDSDGSNRKRLTSNTAHDWAPRWSPDGRKIAFESNRDGKYQVYVMNADGSGQTRLLSSNANEHQVAWSPDGRKLAFTSDRDKNFEIYVVNGDGSGLTRLTNSPGHDLNPEWSYDGSKILFQSERDGNFEIYEMNANGSSQKRVTNHAELDSAPAWAPRRRGVEVSEASVIIPNASALRALTVQQVTAQASGAVVRIETDIASGSGFIIEANGLILTNNHVITGAKKITVFLSNGTSFSGVVIGRDFVRDLAILKIEATGLPTLDLGDLSQVPLGSDVVVIGYPLGSKDITVTKGVASAFKSDPYKNLTLVQTDSAINSGNSGGPLLNLQGQVIGVVSLKLRGAENVGFAVSANTVKLYLERLKAGEIIA